MQEYVNWIAAHPWHTAFLLILMLSKPVAHVLTPQLLSRISINVKDRKPVQRLFVILILTGVVLAVMEYGTVAFSPVYASLFSRSMISDSFSRVLRSPQGTDEDQTTYISKLLNVHQNVNDILGMGSAIVAGQFFSAIAALYIFFTRSPPWFATAVALGLIVVTVLMFSPGQMCVDRSRRIIQERNDLMSDISDVLASAHMVNADEEGQRTSERLELFEKSLESERSCRRKRLVTSLLLSGLLTVASIIAILYLHMKKKITSDALIELLGISLSLFEVCMRSYDYITVFTRVKANMDEMEQHYKIDGETAGIDRMQPPGTAIRVDSLVVPFTDRAVRVTFEVAPGESVCITAPNAAGKSRILKVLAGVLASAGGRAYVPSDALYVPQNAWLLDRSIEENVGVDRPEIWIDVLQRAGLDEEARAIQRVERAGKKGYKLSGGQRQIIWLARALISPSTCLILDEPTASMSESATAKAAKALMASGKTILLVSHDEVLQKACDRVLKWEDILVS